MELKIVPKNDYRPVSCFRMNITFTHEEPGDYSYLSEKSICIRKLTNNHVDFLIEGLQSFSDERKDLDDQLQKLEEKYLKNDYFHCILNNGEEVFYKPVEFLYKIVPLKSLEEDKGFAKPENISFVYYDDEGNEHMVYLIDKETNLFYHFS